VDEVILADWQSSLSAIAASVAALGLFAVATAAWWARSQVNALKSQVRELDITRQASVMIELESLWRENKITEARRTSSSIKPEELCDRVKTAREDWNENYFQLIVEPDFFESLAVLVKNRCVDYEIVKDVYGVILIDEWRQWEPTVRFLRLESVNRFAPEVGNSIYQNFEALAKRIRGGTPS
jgi:Domain of unknown function (DUF4760)